MANFCKNCGSQLSPSDSVCPSCGEPIPGAANADNAYGQYSYGNQNTYGYQNTNGYQNTGGYQSYGQTNYSQPYYQQSAATTVAGWIGWMLLCSFLPVIGQIIIIVSARDESLKNYAKATLILSAIAVVLTVIFYVLFGAVILSGMKNF
ncbi:zinc-ribbon domain-containing protein [Ruminococcus sp. YE71]|uniref:zinc ribbon domain-containing protein n=1 Tax=unclassified Ruminococcus TaxID=2608920 RepID=UPI000883F041|nr:MULTISPECIES: zinc ribbon domain-containing protein [unclassified Ruminococcus]SDA25036.1 zinc-ribbon domain-containing protein [Ruminococcus sp. YE78]SFW43106.1 zinc-ribbon domain-containing protein [Ruminococcus sp. YE71]